MIKPLVDESAFDVELDGLDRLLRDGVACLGFSGPMAEHSIARRTIDLRGISVSVISLGEPDDMKDHDLVLAAPLYGVDVHSPHALEFLFEINLANTLAGAGAFGRDKEGNLLLLKAMRSAQLDGTSLAAHMQWMVALVESVRDELRKIH
jgi:hypothetical protein